MSERTPRTGQAAGVADDAQPESAAGNLFDLRVMIGGLFVFYGAVLIIAGIFTSSAELHKAANININLWMGIGMFILGALFLAWWRAAPLRAQPAPAPQDLQPEPPPRVDRVARAQTGAGAQSARAARPAAASDRKRRRRS
jgi:hypothetical protein